MGEASEAKSSLVMNAKVFEKVRKNNINEDTSFNSPSESIRKTLNQPYSTFMHSTIVVENHVENDCKKCCKVNQLNK